MKILFVITLFVLFFTVGCDDKPEETSKQNNEQAQPVQSEDPASLDVDIDLDKGSLKFKKENKNERDIEIEIE